MFPRNVDIWLVPYLKQVFDSTVPAEGRIDILFCVADHFEPRWNRPDGKTERARVAAWKTRYPPLADWHRDADGRCPQHTFFYPEEEYRPEHLDALAELCKKGYGEVEVHLHHDRDTPERFREKLERFKQVLADKHGLLSKDRATGRIEYGFIHGNWALNNARKDGRWCGINDELSILRETGCYADFTLPSAPSETQTAKINSLYYATGDPNRPKSHDTGIDVAAGRSPSGDLLMIQGPLGLNLYERKWGLLPKIENGELGKDAPPTPRRADIWISQHIHVRRRPEWIFVKVHTHGAQDEGFGTLLGKPMDALFAYLESNYNDGKRYRLHYVTAREMYNVIKAAEACEAGNPHQYRDYRLIPVSS